ncbi:MAG: hypothetical protein KBD55_02845 [Candidatus Pacebacteria bacterium]|jgi:hypothetical protein|nr:hypothetical protein [Candidatus Paceibacterota bacterium]
MKKYLPFIVLVFILSIFVFPSVNTAYAAYSVKTCNPTTVDYTDIICKLGDFLKALVPLMVMLGVVYFVWGVVQYMIGGGEEAKKEGRDRIIYGLIGFVVIAGMWGLVSIVVNTFGFTDAQLAVMATPGLPVAGTQVQPTAGDACEMGTKLQGVLSYITCLIGASVIPFIFALATGMFIWGVVNYFILGGGEEEKRSQGKQFMIWGIIALVVMLSVWGIVGIVGETFNLNTGFLPRVKP